MLKQLRNILTPASALLLVACASTAPVLYPNNHLKNTNSATVDQDIAECQQAAKSSGATNSSATGEVAGRTVVGAGVGAATGAAVGAVIGNPARGAAAGAAGGGTSGLFSGIFRASEPSPVYKRFVDKCLSDKGYEPIGWQ